MAKDFQDTALLTRIEGGDVTALEARYNLSCLTGLRNMHRSLLRQSQSQGLDQNLADKVEARAFVELATHIENSVKSGTFCFKFSVLRQMYKNHLSDLGVNKQINKVCFKEQVLDFCCTAQEQSHGKNIFLIFEPGMQEMLKRRQATKSQSDYQEDVLTLGC